MRFLVAIALLFSITPGMSEVAEAAVHVVLHADLPHHGEAAERNHGCDEHNCTPLAHHCGCHSTMFAQSTSKVVYPDGVDQVSKCNPMVVAGSVTRACEPPPLPPPIG